MSDDSSELVARVLTAIVSIPLLLGLIFWAPDWGFFGLVFAAVGVTVWEYCTITYGDEHLPGKIVAIALALGLATVLYWGPEYLLEALLVVIGATFLFFLFTFPDRDRVSHHIGSSVTAIVYGSLLLGVLGPLHAEEGPFWIVLTMVTTWMSDTGAYFVGRSFGDHPLYEEVSPNKSIEGSIGGLIGSVVGAAVCNWLFPVLGDWSPLAVGPLLLLAIPGNLLAQLGDLAESIIKRAHDVDDSGVIIYGHGGLLDRIDGLIFASPWFYICATHWV